jgi:hypothetical protein
MIMRRQAKRPGNKNPSPVGQRAKGPNGVEGVIGIRAKVNGKVVSVSLKDDAGRVHTFDPKDVKLVKQEGRE